VSSLEIKNDQIKEPQLAGNPYFLQTTLPPLFNDSDFSRHNNYLQLIERSEIPGVRVLCTALNLI
jgi:hypothetical protein